MKRRVVFEKDVGGIKKIEKDEEKMIMDMDEKDGGGYRLKY